MHRDLVVIGASTGGIEALRALVADLPGDFPAAICVVVHIAADSPGYLGHILGQAGRLRAVTVTQRRRLRPSTIYVPRPDRHLVVEPTAVRATSAPRENRFRPAIDPLFRSAAQAYGPRCVGAILTGDLDDGTSGLWAVKQLGGVAIVQDPEEAIAQSMPQSALHRVRVDHRVRVEEMAALLIRLVAEDLVEAQGYRAAPESPPAASGNIRPGPMPHG